MLTGRWFVEHDQRFCVTRAPVFVDGPVHAHERGGLPVSGRAGAAPAARADWEPDLRRLSGVMGGVGSAIIKLEMKALSSPRD